MNNPAVAYIVIFGGLPTAGIIAGWLGGAWWDRHPGQLDDQPVPYLPTGNAIDALATAVQCTWCTPRPRGLCSCSVRCGHVRCVHVAGRGWTRDDRDILDGKRSL